MKLILVFALLLGMVPGCSDPETVTPPEPVQVQLKWRHQAQFAGIYMAMEKGFYTDQNLAVTSIARTPGVTNQKISQAWCRERSNSPLWAGMFCSTKFPMDGP